MSKIKDQMERDHEIEIEEYYSFMEWVCDQIHRSAFDTKEPSKKMRKMERVERVENNKIRNETQQKHIIHQQKGHRRSDWHKVK